MLALDVGYPHRPYILCRMDLKKIDSALFARLERKTIRPLGMCGCWIWKGATRSDGHGKIHIKGKQVGVHRIIFEIVNDCILSKDILVRHKCDNPPCWNPEHLQRGTSQDNSNDMKTRGRSPHSRGASNNKAKLTSEQVLSIRGEREQGVSYNRLSKKYGVSPSQISGIVNRKFWTHI